MQPSILVLESDAQGGRDWVRELGAAALLRCMVGICFGDVWVFIYRRAAMTERVTMADVGSDEWRQRKTREHELARTDALNRVRACVGMSAH